NIRLSLSTVTLSVFLKPATVKRGIYTICCCKVMLKIYKMVFLQLDIRFIYSMVINRPLALCTLKDYIAHFYYTLLTGSITCKLPYFSKQSVYGCANL